MGIRIVSSSGGCSVSGGSRASGARGGFRFVEREHLTVWQFLSPNGEGNFLSP